MQFDQAIAYYQQMISGFDLKHGVPNAQEQQQAMQVAQLLAMQAEPSDAFKQGAGYVHQWLDEVRRASPEIAEQIQTQIITNPEAESLVKSMEFMLGVTAEHSPETWAHVKRMGALTARMAQTDPDINPLRTVVGSMFHDAGKIAIHPDLLHKAGRIDAVRFTELVGSYDRIVPDYPQKEHDLKFLIKANEGRVVFADADEMTTSPSGNEMVDVDALPQQDLDMPDVSQRVTHSHILARILAHAQHSGLTNWMSADEIDQLASTRRGTLTELERAIIDTHDPMSQQFVALQTLPESLKGLEQLMDMKEAPAQSVEANIIHHADVFEALTAERSYKPPYTVSDALVIMNRMAEKGTLDKARVDGFVNSDIWMDHAQQYGCELGDLSHINDMKPEGDAPKWSQSVSQSVKQDGQNIQINIALR